MKVGLPPWFSFAFPSRGANDPKAIRSNLIPTNSSRPARLVLILEQMNVFPRLICCRSFKSSGPS
jgi:hypothetical protein